MLQVGSEDKGRESTGLSREEEWVLLQHGLPERGAVLGDGGACECGESWMGPDGLNGLGMQRRESLWVSLCWWVGDMCDVCLSAPVFNMPKGLCEEVQVEVLWICEAVVPSRAGEALWDSAFTVTPLQPPQGTYS